MSDEVLIQSFDVCNNISNNYLHFYVTHERTIIKNVSNELFTVRIFYNNEGQIDFDKEINTLKKLFFLT